MNPFKPTLTPISSRDSMRIDNKLNPRAVTGWTLTGSTYRRGIRIPGSVTLQLEGGGILWYPESTPLDTALADAADRGFLTSAARAKLADWVKTGNDSGNQITAETEMRECRECRRRLPVAVDQTDTPPLADEVILDAAGETAHRNYYVCGRCWAKNE